MCASRPLSPNRNIRMITIENPPLSRSPFVPGEDRKAPPTGKREKRFRSHFPLADSGTTMAELAVPPDTKNTFFRYEQTAKSAKKRSLKLPRLHLSSPYPPFVLSEGSGLQIRPKEVGFAIHFRSRRTAPQTSKPEKWFRSHFPLVDSATTTAEFAVSPDTKNIFFRYERTAKSTKKRSTKIPRLPSVVAGEIPSRDRKGAAPVIPAKAGIQRPAPPTSPKEPGPSSPAAPVFIFLRGPYGPWQNATEIVAAMPTLPNPPFALSEGRGCTPSQLPYPPFVLSEGSGCTPSQLPYPPFVLSEGRGLYIRPTSPSSVLRQWMYNHPAEVEGHARLPRCSNAAQTKFAYIRLPLQS